MWYTDKTFQGNEVSPTEKKGIKIAAQNRKAFHDYFVEDRYEAGIELAGTEVKSIRQGHVNLKDSFCIVKDGQMSVIGMHISPYEKGNIFNKDPMRQRRLLMHKREILRLFARIKQELEELQAQLEGVQAVQKAQAVDEVRMAEIAALLEKFKESDLTFDDLLVRKVVETVRVESTEKLEITFKDGNRRVVELPGRK